MPKVSRRHLIGAAAATTALSLLGGPFGGLRAATPPARRLIVVLNYGGWDVTYALDAKPDSTSVDTPEGEFRRFAEIPVWVHASRPAVTRYFERYADRTAVVNGVQVRSFIHTDCVKRILTGTPSEDAPDLGARVAHALGRDLPVPYLVLGKNARSGPLASITGRAGTTNQVAALVSPDAAYPDPGSSVPRVGFEPTASEAEAVERYLTTSAERVRAVRGLGGSNARRVREFVESLDRARLFREFARDGFGGREYTPDLSVQIPVGIDALEGELSRAVMMESGDDWDTHQNNERQSTLFESAFGGLETLVATLEARGLLDETLIVVLSEMGRTPKLNAGLGKDHWPVTSALLIGAGVRGGRLYGASSAELAAESIDLETGAPSAGGKQLQTPNLLAGVLEVLGLDPASEFPDVEPFRAFVA